MYAVDLEKEICSIEPEVAIDVNVHATPVLLGRVQRSVIESRLENGDRIILAEYEGKCVAYLFAATGKTYLGEIDDWLIVSSDEVYLYDAFTASRLRGKGIYPYLITYASAYFKKRGFKHALIFSTASNTASIKGIEKCGFRCYETVRYRNLLGWKSWKYEIRKRFVDSRLSNEN